MWRHSYEKPAADQIFNFAVLIRRIRTGGHLIHPGILSAGFPLEPRLMLSVLKFICLDKKIQFLFETLAESEL